MNKRILVTYASRTGSTAEIAEAITKTLSQNGTLVDLVPIQEVTDVSQYHAVVVGSAIRGSKWMPEAMDFIRTHRTELLRKRVATFTVCITLAMSNSVQYRNAVAGWIDPVRAQLRPVSEGLFAGVLDFTRLPRTFETLKLRLVVALGIFPREDRRDWNAIRVWTESLPVLLQ